jgi:histidinol-phosphatase (PHP family)
LDYFIGSVHYIGKFQDGSHFCFDGQPEAFFEGIAQLYQNNFKKAITDYFHSVMRMVEVDCPDIIGHLDKIKMHNTVKPYFSEDDPWYITLIEETLEVIRQKGCIVEVNTRGLYKHDPPLLYPGTRILDTIRRKKIPVMINSDAHHPNEVELGFATTAKLLNEMGFRTLRILNGGKWHDQPFTEKGLIF